MLKKDFMTRFVLIFFILLFVFVGLYYLIEFVQPTISSNVVSSFPGPLSQGDVIFLSILFFMIFLIVFGTITKKPIVNYYLIFILGVLWLIVGVFFGSYILSIIGVVLAVLSLVNKSEWKIKPERNKKFKLIDTILLIVLLLLVLSLLLFFVLR